MSRAAKTTFLLSAAISTLVVVGVHYQQSAERENMYQGVVRDQARLDAKRAASQEEEEGGRSTIVAPPLPPSQATPEARYQDLMRNREREREFQRVQPTRAFLEQQHQQGEEGSAAGRTTTDRRI